MFQTRKEHMSVERNPTAFGDLRGWIDELAAHGELQEIDAQVDWNIELGTIMRLAQGPGTGKALLFNNIKDYNTPASRCRRIFGSALNNYRRIAMMFGLPPDTHPRELVKIGRTALTGSIPPTIVPTGPVPGPCASRMMVPSSIFGSTSASISCSSPADLSALIQPRRSP